MAEHPIEGLMQTAMENLKEMIDVNTIIGDPVETPDGSVILPISKVGFGFAAGGSEFDMNAEGLANHQEGGNKGGWPFGGGAGGGVSITPIGFLVVGNGQIKMLSTEGPTQLYERIIDMAPGFIEKIQSMTKKDKMKHDECQAKSTNPPVS
ncbi:putative spore protein YtfJ [Collibacillus ludicampi]|jgi:sporulation protein YtfJ|uniref:Spore protein YtfJ n=1 Tax=Collibacillus ludicampi TaxID=2771369 RepID=A0AAV4LL06_9BACL|nr:GerW family sporulation protein [Collibacillus ludicampi]GIM48268.1 putative spore protein YtfJ [Collibacillus ludicampi]GIM48547.1 putative spore protein YtfJ [Collibacillus ludicampi]